jgi:transposase
MFIRDTHKVNKKSGKKYTSHQLVESFRTSKGPRQRILFTIDSSVQLSQQDRKTLANRIEDIVTGYDNALIDIPEHIEVLAKHFAQLILKMRPKKDTPSDNAQKESKDAQEERSETGENQEGKNDAEKGKSPQEHEQENITDFQPIDLNHVKNRDPRSIGAEYIMYSAYRDLGLPQLFASLGFSKKQQKLAAATIIARAVAPASERATHQWLQKSSGLEDLLDDGFGTVSLNDLYHISDQVILNKKKIESHLSDRERNLFNLKEGIILYDITNTYFEGVCKGHPKAHLGKSKEMRSDCPLISFGVVLDSDGFAKHSEIFAGNVNERATLQEMISRLDRGQSKKPIVVIDAGIATKENIEWLKSEGYLYLVMMKQKYRPLREEASEIVVRDDGKQYITASLVKDKESGDNLLYCYSKRRYQKENDIKESKVTAFENELKDLRDGLTIPRKMKKADRVKEKIGRLKQQYSRVSQHYKIEVHVGEDPAIATSITWEQDSAELERSFSGTYSMRTNVIDVGAKNLWEIYVMLSEAESCYRCLKSEAGFRPIHHHKEGRIDGHLFISLLAYHLISTIQMKLKQRSIFLTWETIRNQMKTQVLVTSILKHQNGNVTHIRTASVADPFHEKIYDALNLSTKPCGYKKKTVGTQDVVSNIFKKNDEN